MRKTIQKVTKTKDIIQTKHADEEELEERGGEGGESKTKREDSNWIFDILSTHRVTAGHEQRRKADRQTYQVVLGWNSVTRRAAQSQ